MKIATTCPVTEKALYISDVKPNLKRIGAAGDWGYSTKSSDAYDLTARQAMICMKDMESVGRSPRFI